MFIALIVIAVVAALVLLAIRLATAGRRSEHEAQPVAIDATHDGAARAPKPHGPGDPQPN